jgi:hypothetical protein
MPTNELPDAATICTPAPEVRSDASTRRRAVIASSVSMYARMRPLTDTVVVAATTGTCAVGDTNGSVMIALPTGVFTP